MTVVLTRRFFLFGSAAVIAATQIPTIVDAVQPIVKSHPIGLKRIGTIEICPLTYLERTDGWISLKIRRDFSSQPIFCTAMNAQGCYRWYVHHPMDEIITINKPLILDMETNCPVETGIQLGNSESLERYSFSDERGLRLEGEYALFSV